MRPSKRWGSRLTGAGICVTVTLLAGLPARGNDLYDVNRQVREDGNQCSGTKSGCVELWQRFTHVDGKTSRQVTYSCTARRPYLHGWDARHSEHVSLTLQSATHSPTPVAKAAPLPPGAKPQTITLRAQSQIEAKGFIKVVIGCGRLPGRGGMMTSLASIPSRHVGFSGGRP